MYALTDPDLNRAKYTDAKAVRLPWWTGGVSRLLAAEASTGKVLWRHESAVVPLSLAVSDGRAVFHDGSLVHCLDAKTGLEMWRSAPVPMVSRIMSFFAPTMVVREGVVLFAGGEESGLVKSTGGATKSDTLTALDAATGKVLWTAKHPPSGYSSPEDLFVTGGLVWSGGVSNGNLPGVFTGRRLRTGEVVRSFEAADVDTYWFHHRCHRGKATDDFLMVSRTGIEFVDPKTGHWDINHWTRGGCLYGIMPANGLVYAPPHACACYPESKTFGFNAMAAGMPKSLEIEAPKRLEKGPSFAESSGGKPADDSPIPQSQVRNPQSADWPTYRHDAARSGASPGHVADSLAEAWATELRGRLSSVTVADGTLFVAEVDRHSVHALDASTGRRKWSFVAGGRVDSPPTIHGGLAVFGCVDGFIYCVRVADGQLAWRFRAAPADERIMAFEQIESRWPLHGSVLVHDGDLYAIAGRSLFLDGGLRLCRLDAVTGRLISEVVLDRRDPDSGDDVQSHVKRLTMPVALPDVLSCDGSHMYMRSQVFDMAGKRLELAPVSGGLGSHAAVQEGATKHLFASAGFLDDTWFHRSYWVYGRKFEGGWNSYYLAGKRAPAGKLLVADEKQVYGFGRQPKYFKWTVPMEFHLFAAPRMQREAKSVAAGASGSVIRLDKSKGLDPSGKAITAMAWVKPGSPNGVVLAHGGSILGYALYLKKGVPCFTVRSQNKGGEATASKRVDKEWTHLAGVLTSDAQLRVYVNGKLAGTAKAPELIRSDPSDGLQVGRDEKSQVVPQGTAPFKGLMDEVRIYHRGLSAEELAACVSKPGNAQLSAAGLVVHFPFEKGKVSNASDRKLRASAVGLRAVEGRVGRGMAFSGDKGGEVNASAERFAWSREVPILVRGMVAAGGSLYVAGADDVVDEPSALKALSEKATLRQLVRQESALAGEAGGLLRVVSCEDGKTLADLRLETIPVWDGLVAARGCLFMAGVDGTVRCYKGR